MARWQGRGGGGWGEGSEEGWGVSELTSQVFFYIYYGKPDSKTLEFQMLRINHFAFQLWPEETKV